MPPRLGAGKCGDGNYITEIGVYGGQILQWETCTASSVECVCSVLCPVFVRSVSIRFSPFHSYFLYDMAPWKIEEGDEEGEGRRLEEDRRRRNGDEMSRRRKDDEGSNDIGMSNEHQEEEGDGGCRRSNDTRGLTEKETDDYRDDDSDDAAAPQGWSFLLAFYMLLRSAAVRHQRYAVACRWIAGERRKRRKADFASGRAENVAKIAIPAPGAVQARGWALAGSGSKPPLSPAPVALRHRAGGSVSVRGSASLRAMSKREKKRQHVSGAVSRQCGWYGRSGGGDAVRKEDHDVDGDDDSGGGRRHDEEDARRHSAAFEPYQRKRYTSSTIWIKSAAAVIVLLCYCRWAFVEETDGLSGARATVATSKRRYQSFGAPDNETSFLRFTKGLSCSSNLCHAALSGSLDFEDSVICLGRDVSSEVEAGTGIAAENFLEGEKGCLPLVAYSPELGCGQRDGNRGRSEPAGEDGGDARAIVITVKSADAACARTCAFVAPAGAFNLSLAEHVEPFYGCHRKFRGAKSSLRNGCGPRRCARQDGDERVGNALCGEMGGDMHCGLLGLIVDLKIETLATGVPWTQCWVSRRRSGVSAHLLATGACWAQCCGGARVGSIGANGLSTAPSCTHLCLDAACIQIRGVGGCGQPCCADRSELAVTQCSAAEDRRAVCCVRYGEARHPGPPAGSADSHGGLSVTTGNGTGWGTILDWLSDHKGHIVCAQEHKVMDPGDIEYEKVRALARGWKSFWSPAVPSGTQANEPSGGAVVLVRSHVGAERPPGGETVVPGRVAAAMVETSGLGWVVLYSIYGICGDELGARNWAMCERITNHAIRHGLPWCAAGDWNFEPHQLRASGWLVKMGAEIITAPVASTTHAGGRAGRHLDYFVTSRTMFALGPRVSICADAIIRTHDAVTMRLPVHPRRFRIRRIVRPRCFPRELPIGPRPQLVTPASVVASARAALERGEGGDDEAAKLLINEATAEVIGHLENTLVEAYMIADDEKDVFLGRSKGVSFAMGQLTGPKAGKFGDAAPSIRRLRAIQDKANALAAAIGRQQRRMAVSDGRSGDDQPNGVNDTLERARAAIKTGHHIAAIDGRRENHVAKICTAYALELKSIGKWAEGWAEQTTGAGRGGPKWRGRCLIDTTLPTSSGLCCDDEAPSYYGGYDWLGETAKWCRELSHRAAEAAEPAEALYRNEKAAAVRRWAEEASQAGAAMAHRWTKVPEGWRPETVGAEVDGATTITADPGAVVEAERDKWHKLWCPPGVAREKLTWAAATQLERPSVEMFRRAARRIPRTTGIGVEGILPADFDALDDAGIDACVDVMMACEAIGFVPEPIALVLVRMIPKRDGGRRPIGLLPSLYRIWSKVRVGYVRDWERRWARTYFAAGPGKAADAAAWRTALRAEMAASAKADSASVLWDLLKCFEHGRHFLLAKEAGEVEFPIVIARMSAEMYRAERRLVVDDAVSEAVYPTRGFMAGCARALALIKVLMVRRMDAYIARHPRVNLDVYVDDVELQAIGTGRIAETLASAVLDLRSVLVDELGFPLAEEKARVISSNADIAAEVIENTGGAAGKHVDKAVKLGVELSSGKRIGRRGGHKRGRLLRAMARKVRIFRFKKMGGAATKVVRRGVIPSTAYGGNVTGTSDAELRRIRALVAQTSAPNTRGASVALKLLIDGDPAIDANAAPIVKWAEMAWDVAAPARVSDHPAAGVPGTQRWCDDHAAGAQEAQRLVTIGRITGAQLHGAIAHAMHDTKEGSWETVRGPASATVLTARRVNWTFRDGTTVIDERGRSLDMAVTAPACIRNAVNRATRKAAATAAAERWGKPEFSSGIWTAPVRTAVGRLPPAAKAALRRAWTGGYWARARLADAGLVNDSCCDKCGARRDDDYHRIWECSWECVKVKRDAVATPQMLGEAARVGRDDFAYTRGLRPTPWASNAPPRDDYLEVHVDGDMNELDVPLVIDRPVFIDGSALWPSNAEARRAGWSVVMVDDDGNMIGAVYGHLPWAEGDEQTAGGAEMYALRRAAEMTVVPLVAYTDYKEAAEGAIKGEAATAGPKVKHATHWRAFWKAVDDTAFSIIKVKGHVTEAEVAHDQQLKWRREGNRHADRLAKRGARAHYTDEQWAVAKKTIQEQEYHADLCTWIGTALGCWPTEKQVRRKAVDREAMKERRQKRRDAARLVGGHRVAWGRDGWKCQDCGTQARTHSGAMRLVNQPCGGHITTRIPMQRPSGPAGHVLWTAEADDDQGQGGANVTWCAVCGAYSSSKLYKLRGICSGPAQNAARTRLRALQSLRHPVLNYKLKRPHRMSDTLLNIMNAQAADRRRRYDETFRMNVECDDDGAADVGCTGTEVGTVTAEAERGTPADYKEDDHSEQDVFGHGGGMDEEDAVDPRSVPFRLGAVEGGLRTVPLGHVAGSLDADRPIYIAKTGSEDNGDEVTVFTNFERLVPGGHSASTHEPRAEPSGHAAAQRRGTKVWSWAFNYGKWRWVPASDGCDGRPCICDLKVTLGEIIAIRAERNIPTAAGVDLAISEIEELRHARRRAEREAMAAEDAASSAIVRYSGHEDVVRGRPKKRRIGEGEAAPSPTGAVGPVNTECMGYDGRAADKRADDATEEGTTSQDLFAGNGSATPVSLQRKHEVNDGAFDQYAIRQKRAAEAADPRHVKHGRRHHGAQVLQNALEESGTPQAISAVGSYSGRDEALFANRDELIQALRAGDGQSRDGDGSEKRCMLPAAAGRTYDSAGLADEQCEEHGPVQRRKRRRLVAESSPEAAGRCSGTGTESVAAFTTRQELLNRLRGNARSSSDYSGDVPGA